VPEDREIRIKRLLHQSWYRGCKETDKILGQFAKENLHQFGDKELDEFDAIMNEEDWDIWNWVTGKISLPEEMQNNSVMLQLMKFKFADSDY
jgi:antitoxin CptB